jgi:hypothetical protein
MKQVSNPSSVTLACLLKTANSHELDKLLASAADQCGYCTHLHVAWDYWHYGRHAEFAKELGFADLARLFSAAWQIAYRVHGADAKAAEQARSEILAEYAEGGSS